MVRFAIPALCAATLGACAPGGEVVSASEASVGEVRPTLFVANKRGNTLSKIDLATGEEVLRRDSCTNPHELATSPDGKYVALACYGGTTVDIFRTDSLDRVTSIDLGENARPHGIAWKQYDGDLDAIYVTAEGRKSIFVIEYPLIEDPSIVEIDTEADGTHMIAIGEVRQFAWTVDMQSGSVTLIDTIDARRLRSAVVGREPEGISISPDGKALWVSARGSNKAFELDPMTLAVRKEVDTGRFPLRLAIRPQGDVAITSDLQDGGLSVIDLATAKVVRSIEVSGKAKAQERFQVTILWSDDGTRIYVAETASNTVAEVDYATGKVLRRLSVGDGGDGMAILP